MPTLDVLAEAKLNEFILFHNEETVLGSVYLNVKTIKIPTLSFGGFQPDSMLFVTLSLVNPTPNIERVFPETYNRHILMKCFNHQFLPLVDD